MKRLRLCLLVLMAVLLPLRGAMAAAMLCPPAGVGFQAEVRVTDQPVGHHHQDTRAGAAAHDHGSHDHAAHGHGTSSGDAPEASDAQHAEAAGSLHDECNLCSAFCSATPLVGSLPTLVVALADTSQRYPTLDAPAPLFLSDGQDRPPRSI